MFKKVRESIELNKVGFLIRILLMALLGWIYYRDFAGVVLLLPFALLLQAFGSDKRQAKVARTTLSQFRDFLISVSASVSAGATLEAGIRSAPSELCVIWPEQSPVIQNLRHVMQRMSLNISIEKAISEMGVELKLEDCERFSEVVAICKHSGGNLVNAVRSCANALTEKLDALNEIDSILAQRRLERNILVCVPHAMLALLALMSPDYIELLYTTPSGRVAATVSLLFSGVAWAVSEKIVAVKV